MIELYQFPFSHFCEKARWALDYKGVAYRTVNFLPVFHVIPLRMLARKSSVPVLRDGRTLVQGSSEIIGYLDTQHPASPLTPSDPKAASKALEWETFLDAQIGVTLRALFYYHALSERRLALNFLLQGAPRYKRPLFRLAFPVVRRAMARFMNLNAGTAKRSEECLRDALENLDEAVAGRRFLVEDRFSRADLTACALLSPFCLPDDSEAQARFPAPLLKARGELRNRRFFQWVRGVYESHRHPPTA